MLLGTAHVSRVSADAVRGALEREPFDAVAVELCESRYQSMRDPDAFRQLDLFQVIRQGKVGLVAANLALSAFQRRLAEQFGIEPGAEMKAAIDGADARGLPVWLIDREIGTTLKRAYRSVGLLDRLSIIGGLGASVLTSEEVSEDEVTPTASFVDDLGADSLDVVELVMGLEEEFDIEIPDEDAEKITRVKEAIDYIEAHGKKK